MGGRRLFVACAAAIANCLVLLAPCLLLGLWPDVDLRLNLFLALATALCVVDCLAPDNQRHEIAPLRLADRQHAQLALATGLTLLIVFWSALIEGQLRAAWSSPLESAFGVTLMLLGVALRSLAINALREQFRTEITVPAENQLVHVGIYRSLRHPSETGLLCVAFGAALLLASWCALVVTLGALLPLVLCRLRHEEAELEAAFGPLYTAYRRHVPALIPWRLRLT